MEYQGETRARREGNEPAGTLTLNLVVVMDGFVFLSVVPRPDITPESSRGHGRFGGKVFGSGGLLTRCVRSAIAGGTICFAARHARNVYQCRDKLF